MSFQPIVIIGAARSGTNILRDCLAGLSGFGTWPCDEINLIWRHGNASATSDELSAADANLVARAYIQSAFRRLARRLKLNYVVEKTCANTLRVPFVDAVLPGAKYISIVRDGRDVTASAMIRWTAPIEIGYLFRKLRYAPLSDAPRYGLRFILNRVQQLRSQDRRQRAWGPRFNGLEQISGRQPLAAVCAHQWVRSVEAAETGLAEVEQRRVVRLRYEDFVAAPRQELARVLDELAIDVPPAEIADAARLVRPPSNMCWQDKLSPDEVAMVRQICRPFLARFGYTTEPHNEKVSGEPRTN